MTSSIVVTARKNLLKRRAKVARLKNQNETEGQTLREAEQDWEEVASTEEIADVLLRLSERERREVTEIDAALARMDAGKWGTCERCEEKISSARLAAVPETRLCLACAT